MARMSIDDMIARDTRVDRLAKICGWSRRETRACLEDVWALCYDRVVPYLPAEDIEVTAARDAISPPPPAGFTAALRQVGLARDAAAADRHFVRKDGTRVPWPDQNWRDRVYLSGAAERVGYLLSKRSAGSEGGVKSGQSRRSKTKQSFNSASSESQAPGNPPDPVPDSAPDPVPEDQNSLSPAIPPAVPQPEPAFVPAVSPPAREDIARTQPAAEHEQPPRSDERDPGPREQHPVVREQPRADRDRKPANAIRPADRPFDPSEPLAIGRLAETTYRRVSDALLMVAAELKLPAPIPFPAINPSSSERSREARDRVREEGADAPVVCDRIVANLIAQAREERSVEWLAEKVFTKGGWRTARAWLPKAARPAKPAPGRGGRSEPSPMPTPPKFAPEPPPRSPAELAADWAANKAVAARTVPEIMPMFGDPEARAGPSSAVPTDHDPDENHRRRKAAK